MLTTKLPVSLLTNIADIATHTLLLEIHHSDIFEKLEKFSLSLSEHILEKIQNAKKDEKFFIFYPENTKIFRVVLFFVNDKNIHEKRSEIFRTFSDDVIYVPDETSKEAFENFVLTQYYFNTYKTEKKEKVRQFFVEDMSKLSILELQIPLLESIIVARNLVNMPPNLLNPESFVEMIRQKKWRHFDVEIFGTAELRNLGCNLLRAVGQGSARESFMVIIKSKKEMDSEKYALVGKGVTFDAGGIQIKPDSGMLDMKCDMAGAAAVLGVALYFDSFETLPVNAVFAMGIVENMTGAAAFKPLDVYTAYNGTTVEIHHTDAEGRLVLADVMSYVEKNFAPQHLITMATLTGACMHALGTDFSGIMGDDENLINAFLQNNSLYEAVWRLPLTKTMKKACESSVADIKNLSKGAMAGSSMGGAFLSYFQGNAKFTHLDIAGPAYRTKTLGYMNEGGTGWGVKKVSEVLLSLQ